MSTERFFIENLWRDVAGLNEIDIERLPDLPILKKSQWDEEYELLVRSVWAEIYKEQIDWFFIHCRNRLLMGAFRYGRLGTKKSTSYNHLSSIPKRWKLFWKTYNVDVLFDILNLYLLQWHDTGRNNARLVDFGISCIRVFIDNYNRIILEPIDDGDHHSEKL